VYIKSSEELQTRKEWYSGEGAVHGMLFKSLFGKNPSEMTIMCSGFARKKGEPWVFNFLTFNTDLRFIKTGW
jgi:hypothetical protein